jgi:hypothetical protein
VVAVAYGRDHAPGECMVGPHLCCLSPNQIARKVSAYGRRNPRCNITVRFANEALISVLVRAGCTGLHRNESTTVGACGLLGT